MLVSIVKAVQSIVNVPLQIDSADPEAIEAALRVYNGKAIVNSVNGDLKTLETILPIVKKYGAAVVGLTLDKNGIPETAGERLVIAERIVNKAASYGISAEDVYIDCLTLTSGAEQRLAYETIEAVKLVKKELGVKTVLGVSNISFGLPARDKLNRTFLTIAMAAGLDMPIMNPNAADMTDAVCCYHQLRNTDAGSAVYIERFNKAGDRAESQGVVDNDISFCIKKGLREDTLKCVHKLLDSNDGLTIVNEMLIPVLDEIGSDYERGTIFLPQLLRSAEAAKTAFEAVKQKMAVHPDTNDGTKQKVILATVKGDIHDIGKNIVKTIMENYGYQIIDLGKDVEIQRIVDEAKKHQVRLVGLSALMTTTLVSMEKTIKALKSETPNIVVMVGGAVLTENYAKQIGADYYAKDAMAAVAIARQL